MSIFLNDATLAGWLDGANRPQPAARRRTAESARTLLVMLMNQRVGRTGPSWNNMTGLRPERTPVSISHLPPAPPEAAHAHDVRISLTIAAVLCLAAATIALWPSDRHTKTTAQSVAPAATAKVSATAVPTQPAEAEASPTRFENPFDTSEVFEFPPGTTQDVARESVAEMLLERARERRAQQTARLSSLIAGK